MCNLHTTPDNLRVNGLITFGFINICRNISIWNLVSNISMRLVQQWKQIINQINDLSYKTFLIDFIFNQKLIANMVGNLRIQDWVTYMLRGW